MAPCSDVMEAATDVCLLGRSEARLNLKAVSLSASTNSPEYMTPVEILTLILEHQLRVWPPVDGAHTEH